ncbi:hypothetical protein L195_g049106 [Trifolium pratense]|uniref:Uncharacterized protein n=1 Tax=Trifolium pratense TaxID=57577 RepID=A0A2K3JN78_TRIPR|nr:hypothetical protein L195_g049106 [Trifolium pratense]
MVHDLVDEQQQHEQQQTASHSAQQWQQVCFDSSRQQPPPPGYLKCEVDASFYHTVEATVGDGVYVLTKASSN